MIMKEETVVRRRRYSDDAGIVRQQQRNNNGNTNTNNLHLSLLSSQFKNANIKTFSPSVKSTFGRRFSLGTKNDHDITEYFPNKVEIPLEHGELIYHAARFSFKDHVYIDIHIVEFVKSKYLQIIVFHPILIAEAPRLYIPISDIWYLCELEENPFITEKTWNETTVHKLWLSKVMIRFQRKRAIDFILKHLKLSNSNKIFTATLSSETFLNIHKKTSLIKPDTIAMFPINARKRMSYSSFDIKLEKLRQEAIIQSMKDNTEEMKHERHQKILQEEFQKSNQDILKFRTLSTFLGAPRHIRDASHMSRAAQRWMFAYDKICMHNLVSKLRHQSGLGHLPSLNEGEILHKSHEEYEEEVNVKRLQRISSREKWKGLENGRDINTFFSFK